MDSNERVSSSINGNKHAGISDDSEFIDQSQPFPLAILMTFLVVFGTLVILWWAKLRLHTKRGDSLLLCGITNSGKTVLFSRLTTNRARRTVTSMSTNRGIANIAISTNRQLKRTVVIPVIDIPGNYRIRQRELDSNKSSAKAIIFVVDNTNVVHECKDVADYLYDILIDKHFRQQRIPLLIFFNKQDQLSDNSIRLVKTLLEDEIAVKRRTRASSVSVHQDKSNQNINDDIGRVGKDDFEFFDIKDLKVAFMTGSALGVEKKKINRSNHASDNDRTDEESETDEEDTTFTSGDEEDSNLSGVKDWLRETWRDGGGLYD
ncbi:unnamed protein product [Didymodactylos carnosus]|uniref:Signal recognition particle receptor subunit beta n=1 Tax=Didymodactylos carnosus TaxID=1234261 RepID=A0A813YV53_9BILA|nr:unnamed protein product [Didymodactylos carnosus]CAF0956882.1 unnamed protein product [Didymodactylos carnosus]CAF3674050.1 unnamed protein product [Didymodactylos carnosus]CAF3730006.1 unnamed protein product [Didymodactylos carnosus]